MRKSNEVNDEIFALVDCNSFYCSCERVFQPRLKNKPVVVLSNNDGCIVSLTKEAKALGIPMGAPVFQFKDLIKKENVAVFSSNYTLYGDMSNRVMTLLSEFTPELEIYSIDEAFLSFRGFSHKDLNAYGREIREYIYQCTGIPVSIGIARTKVLAKLANKLAKKSDTGVMSLVDHPKMDEVLSSFPVGDLWGVGRQSEKKLNKVGIFNAKNLRDHNKNFIQKTLTIVGRRIQDELDEISCLDLELIRKPKKEIISSRSFGELLTDITPIKEAVSNHIERASEKLRAQHSVCGGLSVFMHTNPFREQDQQYYKQTTRTFISGESLPNRLISAALDAVDEIYRENFKYKKCGVMLFDLRPEEELQPSLFDVGENEKLKELIRNVDAINAMYGTSTIKFASSGVKKHWQMKSEARSNRYTTEWRELLEV